MPASAVGTAPHFFLSYAHRAHGGARDEGEPDYWASEFFRDLNRSVADQAGLGKGAASGFLERDRRPGDDWPIEVTRALATCRVFVPIYSSRYFADQDCGKEWNFFARRAPDSAAPGAAIVPAIWDPVDPGRLPRAALTPRVNYYGIAAYESLGLYGIMKVSRYRREYALVVSELASAVLAAAQRSPVRDGLDIDHRSLSSAFSPAEVTQGRPADMRVRITVAAPRRDELPDERSDSSFYGSSALDWKPYAPGCVHPVAEEAARVARSLDFWAEVGDLRQHEEGLLSGDPRSGPQILIIDPWALLLPRSQSMLRHFEARFLPWVQVIIPWNPSDDEMRKAKGKLRVALDATLAHKLAEVASTSMLAAHGVPGPEEFDRVLRQLIWTAAKRYLSHAAAYPPTGRPVVRPRIS